MLREQCVVAFLSFAAGRELVWAEHAKTDTQAAKAAWKLCSHQLSCPRRACCPTRLWPYASSQEEACR